MRNRLVLVFLAVAVATVSLGTGLLAAGPAAVPAPEIDGGSVSAGIGLLAAGILLLRARRGAK